MIQATYYVKHPDGSYSEADPQPNGSSSAPGERESFEEWPLFVKAYRERYRTPTYLEVTLELFPDVPDAWHWFQAGIAAQGRMQEGAIQQLFAKHAEQLDSNPYCYFELAYTRQTGWMAWLTDKPLAFTVVNPDRTVIAKGQGDTPEQACSDALTAISSQEDVNTGNGGKQ